MGIETGMQTETFIIFSSNETAIVGKIAQLKVCILNSINSFNVTLKNVLKEKVLPSMALSENVNRSSKCFPALREIGAKIRRELQKMFNSENDTLNT